MTLRMLFGLLTMEAMISPFLVAASDPGLVPWPIKVTLKSGSFELNDQTVIVSGAGIEAEARQLAEALRIATGFKLAVVSTAAGASTFALALDPSLKTRLGNEGYLLTVAPQTVRIQAATATGVFYGGQTFRQLFPAELFAQPSAPAVGVRWQAPAVEIEDYPRFRWRGFLLDVARHYFPPEFLKKTVDLVALHKMNVLQLHLTDDQGWRLEIKQYPELTRIGSVRKESPKPGHRDEGDGQPYGPFFYTQSQMKDLVAYARARHVTILPEIEMPGHILAALTAFTELS